jgi:succinoglycan biosynthesis transport protein ExoP
MDNESGLQFDLIGGVKRQAYMASAVAGAVTLFMYWVAMALPNEYTASAILLVEPQSVSEDLVQAGAAGTDLNERLNLMTAEILSRTRLSRIIEELGLYPDESERMTRQQIVDLMRSRVAVKPVLPELTRGMRTNVVPEINTFEIFFRSPSAKTAADVAQHLANDFIQQHIAARVKTTQTSLEFISAEETRLSKRIAEIDSDLADIKEQNERSLPENLDANQRRLDQNRSDLRIAQRELSVALSDVSFWEHQVTTARTMVSQNDANDVYSARRRVQQLELTLTEMLSRGYTDRHPDVIVMHSEIAGAEVKRKREIADAEAAAVGGVAERETMGPAEQSALAEVQRSQARVDGLELETARIARNIESAEADIAATPRVAEQMNYLERQHAQLTTSLKSFSGLRFDAAVQADLERRQLGERFRILESAHPPREITSPNRVLILGLGVVLGGMLGVGIGVIIEATDGSYHQERDLQSSLGIPVLAVIPSIFFDDDLEKRRRLIRMRTLAMTTVTTFVLLSGFATYIVVNGSPGWVEAIMNYGDDDEAVNEEVEEAHNRANLYEGFA